MRERILTQPGRHGDCWLFRSRSGPGRTHRHDELEFNLVVRGRVTYLVGDRRYDLRRHHLLWLHPDEEHLLVDYSPDLMMWIVVLRQELLHQVCTTATASALTARLPTAGRVRRIAAERTRALDRLGTDLQGFRPALDHTPSDALTTGVIHATVVAWDSYLSAAAAEAHGDVHPAVDQVARLIAAGNDGSVAALAHVVGMHPDTLSRRFHRDLGVRLADYRNRCRVERFCDLIASGRRSVLDAALSAGFGSYPQFHRVFRAVMGTSAREFLRRQSG